MEGDALRRFLLVATIAALSLTALIAIVALLAADFGETELRILATTAGFGLVSLIAMRGTALIDQRRQQALGRAVIGLSALAFVVELWAVWLDTDNSAAWKSYVCVIAAAAAVGQIAGMIGRRRPTDPPSIAPLVWASATCAVVLALMSISAAVAEIDDAGYYQLFGVVAVLDVLGIALQPVSCAALPGPRRQPRLRHPVGIGSCACSPTGERSSMMPAPTCLTLSRVPSASCGSVPSRSHGSNSALAERSAPPGHRRGAVCVRSPSAACCTTWASSPRHSDPDRVRRRVYRNAWSHEAALGLLRDETGTAFDQRCVAALESVLGREQPRPSLPELRVAAASA